MNKKIKYYLFCILLLSSMLCFSQQTKIDSLKAFLKNINTNISSEFSPVIAGEEHLVKPDTILINTLNALAWELKSNNPDTAIILSTQALKLAITIENETKKSTLKLAAQKCIANSYQRLGAFNYFKGDYPLSLDYYFKALKIWESLNNKMGISATLGNMGVVYYYQKDYPKTLDSYLKALKMQEELGDTIGIAINLGNLGNVYLDEANFPKALDYYFKGLKIAEKLGDKNGVATDLINIGSTYNDEASASNLKQNFVAGDSLNKKALDYYFKALKFMEKVEDKNELAALLGNIGSLYTETKKYKESEKYLKKALTLSTEINALGLIKSHHLYLSILYTQTNQPDKALAHYKKYIAAKDSIFNEENTKKTVRSEMNFEFEKKQTVEKAEQEKQNAIAQQEKQKQKIILILVCCFLMLVAVFASFMFNRWRITQKQKLIIEKQKEKIVDSITYAQLIQQSILMEESEVQKLLPNSFIYFQPKDIVSGDFYWCTKTNDKIIIAAVDCTGHGVPGAFMSMIGNTLLNQIINEKQITKPSEILKLLNQEVIESLHQRKNGALSKDGMAIALCSIDYKNNQLEYAGAENPLYILSNNEITVVNADSHGIGSGGLIAKKKHTSSTEYMNHIITMEKGMSIFLFSDGYMDQFGGSEQKKFGVQQFKKLLLNNQHLSMQQQKEIVATAHQDWKENTAQIDDILVIGINL
jgi:serine phosphatase RsbU (regulator of sigma subunit)